MDSQVVQDQPQHLNALQRANEVRLARAEMKRRIAACELAVCTVLSAVPEYAEGMQVGDLLIAQRRWGRTRARKLLGSLSIRENKMLGALTARQRHALVDELPDVEAVEAIRRMLARRAGSSVAAPALAAA